MSLSSIKFYLPAKVVNFPPVHRKCPFYRSFSISENSVVADGRNCPLYEDYSMLKARMEELETVQKNINVMFQPYAHQHSPRQKMYLKRLWLFAVRTSFLLIILSGVVKYYSYGLHLFYGLSTIHFFDLSHS